MKNFFSSDSSVMRVLTRLGDDILYSLLTILLSIPVITAGAAAAAGYKMFTAIRNEEGSGIREWFACFAAYFRKTALMELLFLIVCGAAAGGFWLQARYAPALTIPVSAVLLFLLLAALATSVFAAPILVNYPELSVWAVLKNAFRYGIGYLPRTALLLVAASVPFAVYAVSDPAFYYVGFIWIFFWPGWCLRLAVLLLDPLLQRNTEDVKSAEEEDT